MTSTDSMPTTSTSPRDEQVELREQTVPDVCGFEIRRSSEIATGKAPVHADSDNYNMEHPNRGTCLVFNHAKFEDNNERLGTYADVKRIQKTFGNLGFNVEVCHDYAYQDVKKKIKELSEQDHTDNDCVCIIVLTHGQGNNMIHAKDQQYSIAMLWEPFTAHNCLTLAGKPKLFFISACRGEKRDKGVALEYRLDQRTETDGIVTSSYRIPTEADFLFGFSTPQGYCSWRSLDEGTWYIQSLCDVLDQYAATLDLDHMLTKTALEITRRSSYHTEDETMHNKKQVPEFQSRLIRRVYFASKLKGEVVSQNVLLEQKSAPSVRKNSKPEVPVTSPTKESKSRCDIQ